MNDFFNNNTSSGSRVRENRWIVGQQVWRNAVPNQNIANNTDCAAASHENDNLYETQNTSSNDNAVPEDATGNDWRAHLSRNTFPTRPTSFSYPYTSLAQPAAESNGQPKQYYAHISFVPSADGLRPVVSRRRTTFTTNQVIALEEVFRGKPYITREERSMLACRLAVNDQAIKVWFQNRRLKEKKEREELELELLHGFPEHSPFAHTQALLNWADKDGFVTLDQQSMHELVSAIDKTLPKDLDLAKMIIELKRSIEVEETTSDNVPMSSQEGGTSRRISCSHERRKFDTMHPKQSFLRIIGLQNFNCSF